jgi:hypothetical protein
LSQQEGGLMKDLYRLLQFGEERWSVPYEASNANWKVGLLQYMPQFNYKDLNNIDAHMETDEIFILQSGKCSLLIFDEKQNADKVEFVQLKEIVPVCVNKGTWHTHILSKDAKVVVIENANTCEKNTNVYYFNNDEKKLLAKLAVKNHCDYG